VDRGVPVGRSPAAIHRERPVLLSDAQLPIGCAQCSIDELDLTVTCGLGVTPDRIMWITDWPAATANGRVCEGAQVACPEGDTLVVSILDRLGRPLPDACAKRR